MDAPIARQHETNTALVGDNHGMFHQVGPVGPFDQGTRFVTPRAELAPATDGSGEWAITDRGEIRYQAPLEQYRVSVLWKADVYQNEAEQRRQMAETLSKPAALAARSSSSSGMSALSAKCLRSR